MYQAHFGLKRPLFESGIAQDAGVFLSPKHELIIANSKIALTTLDSAVVITGAAGVGKTTLMSSTLRTTSTRLALGWVTGSPLNGAELLELLLVEFGFNAHRVGRVERMQMWRQFLNEMSATESRVFVIVERAEDLSHEVLRALDSLTAADPNGCPGANLVLLGQPTLLEHLKAPTVESLRQRIRLRERLEPFTADELRAYLAHRVTRAGGTFDKVFGPTAVVALHKLSGGIPRIANNLCETALMLAATGKEDVLTPELLTRIAVAMFGMDTPVDADTAAPPPARSEAAAPVRAIAPPAAPVVPLPVVPQALVASFTAAPAAAIAAPATPTYSLDVTPPPAHAPSVAPEASVVVVTPSTAPSVSPPPAAAAPAPKPPAPPPRPDAAVGALRGHDLGTTKAARPAPARLLASTPPVPTGKVTPPPRIEPPVEIDSFADTLTDSPDVQMQDFPVLTDAVEPPARIEPRPRARAEMAYARPDPAPQAARSPSGTPTKPAAAAQPAPAPPPAMSEPPKPVALAAAKLAAPSQAEPESSEEDPAHQTQTVRALAAAKSIDDISNSMAETLFGESDLDMLSAALASAGWSESDDEAATGTPTAPPKPAPKAQAKPAPRPAALAHDEDPFDFLGLGPDAPLELIDDSEPSGEHGRKASNNR